VRNELEPFDRILIDREILRCAKNLRRIMQERNIKMSAKGFVYGDDKDGKKKML
jgi:hypothetical protein